MSEFEIVYLKAEVEEEGKNEVGECSGSAESSRCPTTIVQSSDTLSIIKSEAGIDLYDVEGEYCDEDGDEFDGDEDEEKLCDSKDDDWICGKWKSVFLII